MAKGNWIMKPSLEKILNTYVVHTGFFDRNSVEKCMEQSYDLGTRIHWMVIKARPPLRQHKLHHRRMGEPK